MARALLLSLAAAALLSGCGGSGPTRQSLVDHASSICRTYHARVAKLPAPKTLSAEVGYARRVLALHRVALERLRTLRPPHDDAQRYARWLSQNDVIERDVVRISAAAKTRSRKQLQAAVARARADDARSSRLARALGLDACAKA